MPMVEVECPECGYNKAVYCIAPDENETKLVTRMTCASVIGSVAKCGHSWELKEEEYLFEDCVVQHDYSIQ